MIFKYIREIKSRKDKIEEISRQLLQEMIQKMDRGEEILFQNGEVSIKKVNGVYKIEKVADMEKILEMFEEYTLEKAVNTKEFHDFLVNQKLTSPKEEKVSEKPRYEEGATGY